MDNDNDSPEHIPYLEIYGENILTNSGLKSYELSYPESIHPPQ